MRPSLFRSTGTVLTLTSGFCVVLSVGILLWPADDVSRQTASLQAKRSVSRTEASAPSATLAAFSPAPTLHRLPDLRTVLAVCDERNYSRAVELAVNLPEDQRTAGVASVFGRWAADDQTAAAAGAFTLESSPLHNVAWRAVICQWASVDPASLASYARELPHGPSRHAALAEALSHWLDSDPVAAAAWVNTLVATPESDVAVAAVAQHPAIKHNHPEPAIQWTLAIRDPSLRSRVLGSVIREWRETDPAAAENYARNTPELTASEREDILVGERFTAHP